MDSPKDFEYRSIEQYVDGQLDDEESVEFSQRVTTRRILGEMHEIWDVHTTTGRWWVITPLTNLYSQDEFQSFELALTYHLGLKIRITERSRKKARLDEHRDAIGNAWRRYEQAIDSYNQAEEAEEYQAVGIHCREAFLAVVRSHQDETWVVVEASRPKKDNFKGWNEIFARSLTAGRSRTYLKTLGSKTWDLIVALQHKSSATMWDAELALDATHHYLGTLGLLITSIDRDVDMCPKCGSYRVGGDLRFPQEGVMETCRVCGACEYEWDYDQQAL